MGVALTEPDEGVSDIDEPKPEEEFMETSKPIGTEILMLPFKESPDTVRVVLLEAVPKDVLTEERVPDVIIEGFELPVIFTLSSAMLGLPPLPLTSLEIHLIKTLV